MMRGRAVVRDRALPYLILLCLAVALGWWLRGAGTTVQAQRASSSSSARGAGDGNLAFQMTGAGPDASLTMYNPENRTLYVYPRVGAGNSQINCAYSFRVTKPGAPLERENCPVGEFLPPQ